MGGGVCSLLFGPKGLSRSSSKAAAAAVTSSGDLKVADSHVQMAKVPWPLTFAFVMLWADGNAVFFASL